MAVLNRQILTLRILFKALNSQLLLSNCFRTATQPFNDRQSEKQNGFLSESEWFSKNDRSLKAVASSSGAKINDQPVAVECGNVAFKTWNQFSEIENFDVRLSEVLLNIGHNEMSPIQKHTFDLLNSRLLDILGSAETGSGKTLAFLLPILNQIMSVYPKTMMADLRQQSIQTPLMLVMAPTRELVQQISEEARKMTQLTSFRICSAIGGVNISSQIGNIDNGCHGLIATPGRLIDLLNRGVVSLKYCTSVVLDEADRMLDMGFEPQIRKIVSTFDMPTNENRQTSMFSATFPNDVVNLARKLLRRNFGRIMIGNDAGSRDPTVPESITQSFIMCKQSDLFTSLFNWLESSTNKKTIVFCNTKRDVVNVERFAERQKISVATLYGDLTQNRREQELQAFKTNEARVLIATSVAARGIDVADVECVVNYGMPTNRDEYVHRVGRCGRMGRKGEAVTIVTEAQIREGNIARDLLAILHKTGQVIPDFLEGVTPGEVRTYRSRQDSVRKSFYG